MATLLDILGEYATLGEAKTAAGGRMDDASEARWWELQTEFYDVLMQQDGLARNPASRFSAADIRKTVLRRSRLRVETDMEIVVIRESDYHRARVGNLSCGGVLLLCDSVFDVSSHLTLHIANIARGDGLLPAEGQVVWNADTGKSNGTFRYRMGTQFIQLGNDDAKRLETLVIDNLENKLLSLRPESLSADFVKREGIVF